MIVSSLHLCPDLRQVPLPPQPQLERRPHGMVPHGVVSGLGTSQLAETFKCLRAHIPRTSWQCGMHSPYVTGRQPGKVVCKPHTMEQHGGGAGAWQTQSLSTQAHTEIWREMDEAMVNTVAQPECWLSRLSEPGHTLLSAHLHRGLSGYLSIGSRQESGFCCLSFPWEVTESQQSFLA